MIHCNMTHCVYNRMSKECILQDIVVKSAELGKLALCDTVLPFEETSTQTIGNLQVTVKTSRTIIEQPKEEKK